MAKNKGHESTPAEDYFAQLSWKNRHWRWRRIPSRGDTKEPKWRYKIIYSKDGLPEDAGIFHKTVNGFLQFINWVAGIAVFVLLLMGLMSLMNDNSSINDDGVGLAVIVMGAFVVVTIFAAIRDSMDEDDN